MSDVTTHKEPPRAHVRITYVGPVYPHWEVIGDYGDRSVLEEFQARVLARLAFIPWKDSQFRRNRERINGDALRENISVEWFPAEVNSYDPSRRAS